MSSKPNDLDAVALIELDGKAIGMAVMDGSITKARTLLADFPEDATVCLMARETAIARFQAEF